MTVSLPSRIESLACAIALVVWLSVTAFGIGFRPEHLALAFLIFLLFFISGPTRRLVVALIPFFLFGISYDWMNLLPNYKVNHVDVAGLYGAEKAIFGISTSGGILTPNEFFALHNHPVMDFLAGVFYLCWVPLPIIFGLWLYFTGRRDAYLRFALVFLLVNLIGFAFYYVHPAAPPWYVELHGFEAVPGTPGDVAGLGRFDSMTGLGIFDALYARNSNVFAALPSLHSAYTLVALIYAVRSRAGAAWVALLAVVTVGIWFTAVYTSHHYIIDVLSGIACAFLGFALFEFFLMHILPFRRFISRYVAYISR
ncbi:MAG: phosphatase PAP2 family protein [Muribaculaceae bacterium]|nr:phosphatase PAP2 family protein [Muribaculaceae bacterium]